MVNIWTIVWVGLINIAFISVIVICSTIIGSDCYRRSTECTIWSENGGDSCSIRYNVANYTTICDYKSKCNPTKGITIKCYFDNVNKLDIECPATGCFGNGPRDVDIAIPVLFFSSLFEIVAAIALAVNCCGYWNSSRNENRKFRVVSELVPSTPPQMETIQA